MTALVRASLVAALMLSPVIGVAQLAPDTSLVPPASPVRAFLTGPTLPGAQWPSIEDVSADVQRAYERMNWAPLWSDKGRPTTAAQGVVKFLVAVDSLGLNPRDFDAGLLDSLARAAAVSPLDEETQARFEATLSVATARVLSALRWGRVRQTKAYPTLRRSRDDYDLGAGVYAVSRTPDPLPVFDQAAPQWTPYRQLSGALPGARRIADDSLLVAEPVKKGATFQAAPQLRRLLGVYGIPADSATPPPPIDTTLDASLERLLRKFQKENKVPQTGAFDVATRDRMRAVFRGRVRDAVLSLERWRWLPRTADGRAIIVNVPEYRLRAYDTVQGGHAPAFGMKVVVGRGVEDRYTPLFTDEVEHLIFSPFWEVPKTIALDEIVPKIAKDSTYLARNRYILVRGTSDTAKALAPDSATIAKIGKSVRVRQLPGDYNSLGRIKFMLPNHLNIYLHDTNEKQFFKRDERALSHGCIRVSEPTRLAQWILDGDTAWTEERMKKAMKQEKPETVHLSSHIPVLIVYHTAGVDDHGMLRSFKDVYKYDAELEKLLAVGFPYRR
ncbi:MAG: L,D-transpeptidase family protein [Cytophagaceae bacterium]|nr:L,D-transpeptidase family protein [Gemmatimonadaceae bacterium]